MKRILLIALLAIVVFPTMSQNQKKAKERKHSTAISILRNSAEKSGPEKKESRFDLFEASSIMIRNNANADSMLLFSNEDKADGWQLYAKEIPTYFEGTNLIKELETWSADVWSKTYFPVSKQVASYSDDGKLFRLETHFREDDNWVPQYAEESVINDRDEEVYYAWYNYNPNTDEWEMDEGRRAVDEYNENNIIEERFWEYYDNWEDAWMPDFKEVFTLNENNVVTEITEYWYDDWDETWVPEYKMVFELDENNAWMSGYSYMWDLFEELWFPELKYESMSWFDFGTLKISGLITLMNSAIFDDWDDWDKSAEDEIEWMNFLKLHAEYNADGLLTRMINYMEYDYDEGEWVPAMQAEMDYDHFGNVIYESFSVYNDEWYMVSAYKLDMEYNEDQSVKSYDALLAFDSWKNEFAPVYRYEYYYAEETTGIPSFAKAEEMLVYPNPATSALNMVWDGFDQVIDIDIIGIDGKIVTRFEKYPVMTGQPVSLDISLLKNGVYIIRCQGKQDHQLARFVKR
jgi:hypothetical protein